MKVNIDRVLFEFDPICPRCKINQNGDWSTSTIQCSIYDISNVGWPICPDCDCHLNIEHECEVKP